MATTVEKAAQSESRQQETHRHWLNPWGWPLAIWGLLVCLGLMLVPFAIRTFMLAGVPAIPEPFDAAEFCRWDVPESENAFVDYQRATELRKALVSDQRQQRIADPEGSSVVLEKGWSAADDSVKEWLDANREAMVVWRRGTEKAKGRNLSPDRLRYDSVIDLVQDQRSFCRLALVEEMRLLDEGKLDEAWQWNRAAFRAGGHASYRGCMVQGLVGSALHAMSTSGAARWAEQPAVTADQLRTALDTTRSDYALYELRSNILKAEYLAARNTLASPVWIQIIPLNRSQSGPGAMVTVMRMGYWVVGEPELTARVMRHILANQIREVDKPVSQRSKLIGSGTVMVFAQVPGAPSLPGELDAAGIDKAIAKSFLLRQVLPAMKMFDAALLRQAARQATFEVLLAAQAYRRIHGEFPESLAQLVPELLPAIPLDPCDPQGKGLLYRRDDTTKAAVWSVGDDGNDGGGDFNGDRLTDVGFELK